MDDIVTGVLREKYIQSICYSEVDLEKTVSGKLILKGMELLDEECYFLLDGENLKGLHSMVDPLIEKNTIPVEMKETIISMIHHAIEFMKVKCNGKLDMKKMDGLSQLAYRVEQCTCENSFQLVTDLMLAKLGNVLPKKIDPITQVESTLKIYLYMRYEYVVVNELIRQDAMTKKENFIFNENVLYTLENLVKEVPEFFRDQTVYENTTSLLSRAEKAIMNNSNCSQQMLQLFLDNNGYQLIVEKEEAERNDISNFLLGLSTDRYELTHSDRATTVPILTHDNSSWVNPSQCYQTHFTLDILKELGKSILSIYFGIDEQKRLLKA